MKQSQIAAKMLFKLFFFLAILLDFFVNPVFLHAQALCGTPPPTSDEYQNFLDQISIYNNTANQAGGITTQVPIHFVVVQNASGSSSWNFVNFPQIVGAVNSIFSSSSYANKISMYICGFSVIKNENILIYNFPGDKSIAWAANHVDNAINVYLLDFGHMEG
jgi:hypothetical protein